eukprot:scaffold6711_cov118-Isochrysis_galbana.AAC.10
MGKLPVCLARKAHPSSTWARGALSPALLTSARDRSSDAYRASTGSTRRYSSWSACSVSVSHTSNPTAATDRPTTAAAAPPLAPAIATSQASMHRRSEMVSSSSRFPPSSPSCPSWRTSSQVQPRIACHASVGRPCRTEESAPSASTSGRPPPWVSSSSSHWPRRHAASARASRTAGISPTDADVPAGNDRRSLAGRLMQAAYKWSHPISRKVSAILRVNVSESGGLAVVWSTFESWTWRAVSSKLSLSSPSFCAASSC